MAFFSSALGPDRCKACKMFRLTKFDGLKHGEQPSAALKNTKTQAKSGCVSCKLLEQAYVIVLLDWKNDPRDNVRQVVEESVLDHSALRLGRFFYKNKPVTDQGPFQLSLSLGKREWESSFHLHRPPDT